MEFLVFALVSIVTPDCSWDTFAACIDSLEVASATYDGDFAASWCGLYDLGKLVLYRARVGFIRQRLWLAGLWTTCLNLGHSWKGQMGPLVASMRSLQDSAMLNQNSSRLLLLQLSRRVKARVSEEICDVSEGFRIEACSNGAGPLDGGLSAQA